MQIVILISAINRSCFMFYYIVNIFSSLQYEFEREKLEIELEEQRKSQKERDCYIREQQMKIDNVSNLVTSSESDRSSSQV